MYIYREREREREKIILEDYIYIGKEHEHLNLDKFFFFLLSPANSLNANSSYYSSYYLIMKQKIELRSNGMVTSTIMLHLPLIFIFYYMV